LITLAPGWSIKINEGSLDNWIDVTDLVTCKMSNNKPPELTKCDYFWFHLPLVKNKSNLNLSCLTLLPHPTPIIVHQGRDSPTLKLSYLSPNFSMKSSASKENCDSRAWWISALDFVSWNIKKNESTKILVFYVHIFWETWKALNLWFVKKIITVTYNIIWKYFQCADRVFYSKRYAVDLFKTLWRHFASF
jgi:hypothetical protein